MQDRFQQVVSPGIARSVASDPQKILRNRS